MEKRGKVRKSEVGRIELYTEWLSLAKEVILVQT